MNLNKVYLSLGSNLGDKIKNLQSAINLIDTNIGDVLSISNVYQTKSEGFKGDDFFNCCICIVTNLSPNFLLDKILEIELIEGRIRSSSNGYESRLIDIDILLYEDRIINENNLSIPHPRMHLRNFVLYPLSEIAKSTIHPKCNDTIGKLLNKLKSTEILKCDKELMLPVLSKLQLFKNIVIEGNIGVGKTSLSKRLSNDLNKELIIEGFMDNPFLEKYYNNPERYALNVELTFLTDRCRQLNNFNNQMNFFSSGIIADYDIFKSLVFAGVSLNEIDFNLFRNIFYFMTKDLFKSDLVIYLIQSSDQLLKNISKRGRSFEKTISRNYLDKINTAYLKHIKTNSDLNVVYIDVSDLDFVESDQDYMKLLFRIKNTLTKSFKELPY
ncbi:2-amino-4-hydroxy-6-hydroxymethyldihydropteridine diphosphokinase [Flavobacteriaceae bacterium]|nr:2-amino-4-hydroxy-6-hydroxymethyldihydropteridine diphosphokinase [Flavobacteriaceae bacterium]